MAAVVVLWVSVGAGVYRTGLDLLGDLPVSHLGTDPRSAWLFRGGLILAAGLMAGFSWFVFDWFSAPRTFLGAFLIGLVGQVVAAAVPLSGVGASHAVHTAGGLVLGASLPVLMWRFAAGLPSGRRRRAESYALFWAEIAACIAGIALSSSMKAPIAEIVPAVGFDLWVIAVSIWSLTGPGKGAQPAPGGDAGCGRGESYRI